MQKISVILIVFNMSEYLRDCLYSLINQTYQNMEIICINDGSTDNSLEILYEFAQKDNRIKVYSQENCGIPDSRNTGLNLALGDYITFIDADDVISPDVMETSINIALNTDCDMVVNFRFLNKSVKELSWLTTWQMFIKKSFLDNYPDLIFNPNLKKGSDAVFSHKILALTDKIIQNTGKAFYFYRQHEHQITKIFDKNSQDLLTNLKMRVEDIIGFYSKYNLFKSRSYLLMNFLMEQIFGHYVVSDWNNQQKNELFFFIHSVIKDNNLKPEFNPKDRKSLFFLIFLHCKNPKQFEFVLHTAKIFYKLSRITEKLQKKEFMRY